MSKRPGSLPAPLLTYRRGWSSVSENAYGVLRGSGRRPCLNRPRRVVFGGGKRRLAKRRFLLRIVDPLIPAPVRLLAPLADRNAIRVEELRVFLAEVPSLIGNLG